MIQIPFQSGKVTPENRDLQIDVYGKRLMRKSRMIPDFTSRVHPLPHVTFNQIGFYLFLLFIVSKHLLHLL